MNTQTETAAPTRSTYDPGQPGTITPEGKGRFIVQSFRRPEDAYTVDLVEQTCSCPDHLYRNRICKHQIAARQKSREMALETSRTLPVESLKLHLTRRSLRPEQREAIEQALFEKTSPIPADLVECGEDDPAWAEKKQVRFDVNNRPITAYFTAEQLAAAA